MIIFSRRKANGAGSRLEHAASGIVAICAIFAPEAAQAETRAWINTSLNVEIATNPYLQSGARTSASSGVVSVSPGIKYLDSVKTITLAGDYRHREFSRRYSPSDDYSINASLVQKLSPRLDYNANAGINSSVVGANDLLTFGANPINGGLFPPLPGDIAFNGLRQRRQSIVGSAGFNYTADSRNNVQMQGGFSIVRFPNGSTASEYNNANGSFGYNRIFNSRTSIGLNVSISRANYLRTSLGDATTISPQATFSTKFGATWSLTASLGISHSRVSGLVGKTGQDSAAGRLNLCNVANRAKFCLFASRSVQPTSFGSTVRPQTSVGASYNLRLDSKSTVDVNAAFSRSGQISQGNIVTGGSADYGQASLTYSRRLSQKLQGFLTASYADSYNDPLPRKANSSLNLGISYAFGDVR